MATSRMKPEVIKIFDDLEAWLNHCRFNLLKFDPADLYKSRDYREFAGMKENARKGQRKFRQQRNYR